MIERNWQELIRPKKPVVEHSYDPKRRATLIATRSDRDGTPVYRFDIRLQGENETVFLDYWASTSGGEVS